MQRLALTLMGTLLVTTPAFAENWIDVPGTVWSYDGAAVRALRAHPMERNVDAFLPGDHINFIVRRTNDSAIGTLSLNCNLGRFSKWVLGEDDYEDDLPVSSDPLAEHLSQTYCSQIDALPEAGMLPLI